MTEDIDRCVHERNSIENTEYKHAQFDPREDLEMLVAKTGALLLFMIRSAVREQAPKMRNA